jgi:hypothetical protein
MKASIRAMFPAVICFCILHNGTAAVDIQQGLIIDKVFRPLQPVARPGYLQTITDPAFGVTIRRITDAGSGKVIKPAYSTIPAWSAGESYLLLYDVSNSVHKLYNGKTYAFIKNLVWDFTDIEHFNWSATDPDVLYYPSNNKLIRRHISTDSEEVVHDFASIVHQGLTMGSDPMYASSWDNNTFGFMLGYDQYASGVACRLDSNKVYTIKNYANQGNVAPCPGPSGTRFYLSHEGTGVGEVTDINMVRLGTFTIREPWAHASIGRLANGHDVLFTIQYDDPIVGTLIACDMYDFTQRQIISQSNGYPYPRDSHISAISFQNPGFVVVSGTGTTTVTQILDQEILLVDANGTSGKIARVCHHRSWGKSGPQGYWAEPHAVPSPSGTRIVFGSDWGGTNTVDTYVAELPAYNAGATLAGKADHPRPSGIGLDVSKPLSAGSSVHLRYRVPYSGMVKLELFNSRGQLREVMLNAFRQPGVYAMEWKPATANPGFYFVSITAGRTRITRKVMYSN